MNCKRVRDLFSAFFEDSLDQRSSDLVAKHLAECNSCRTTYERFKSAISLLEAMPEVDPPVNFRASVMARVEETRRTAPTRVKWWSLDWQRVFTIRVPARALAVGIAVLVAFVVSVQLVPPLRTGIASLFWTQKPADVSISTFDQDTVRAPRPWTPENEDNSAVVLSVGSTQPGVYLLKINSRSSDPVKFDVDVSGTRYSGYVSVNRPATIRVPAPAAGSVRIVHAVWSIREWGRYHTIFLPSRLQHRAVLRTFEMSGVTVADVLQRICREYGVAIIAWGNMGKSVGYVQVYQSTPEEAFYECLSRVGLKADGIASSVYVVGPVR
ncbi:MAG: anti-sigma factor family protein [Armatimonadota bacterium]